MGFLIKEILKKAKIKSMSLEGGIGSTGEAHLAVLNKKKYLLRICKDNETAEKYFKYYNKFKKYNFLPRLLDKKDHYLLFAFINGEVCNHKETKKVIAQIGRICAIINKSKEKWNCEEYFSKRIAKIEEKKILDRGRIDKVKELYLNLKTKVRIQTSLDANDVTNDNFIKKTGKVYFVDIEAIKPTIKGYGIAKAFFSWFKEEKEREYFREGYNTISPISFFNTNYMKLATLLFIVQRLNFKFDKGERGIVKLTIKKLDKLLAKNI